MPHTETFIDGVWYPSVTTVMDVPKPWLQAWRDKWGSLATRKVEIASAIGTAFHDCIEQYFERGYWAANIPKYPSCERRINGMMKSWIKLAESVDGDILATELKVINKKYVYSGTIDCVMTMDIPNAK